MKMAEWLKTYRMITRQRFQRGEIKTKTLSDYRRLFSFCEKTWADRELTSISVSEITQSIHEKSLISPHSARRLRINLSNLFVEAQREGAVPLGHNPALVSRYPSTEVKTSRLSLDEWMRIFRCAKYRSPDYFQNAMLLALVTAQRPSDLVRMHRSDIFNGYLHIRQFKTGEKIAIPTELRLDVINTSLSEVIELCPGGGPLLQNERGQAINTWSISRWFKICREDAGVSVTAGKLAPPFREQRSLSERLYRAQGIDTMTLLGHKYQHMTDRYNDIRGKDYRKLSIHL